MIINVNINKKYGKKNVAKSEKSENVQKKCPFSKMSFFQKCLFSKMSNLSILCPSFRFVSIFPKLCPSFRKCVHLSIYML